MYYTVSDIKPSALYSRAEAARILGVSVSTLFRLRKRGMVKPVFVSASSRAMYKGSDLISLYKVGPSKLRVHDF